MTCQSNSQEQSNLCLSLALLEHVLKIICSLEFGHERIALVNPQWGLPNFGQYLSGERLVAHRDCHTDSKDKRLNAMWVWTAGK